MTDRVLRFGPLDPEAVEVVLCDADGNLFGSEEPAFEASTEVTNRLLAGLGSDRAFTPDALRCRSMGRTFRATVQELAAEEGATLAAQELECWVVEERAAVISHLASVLHPDPDVERPLRALREAFDLAVVSSSALERLAACFAATGLDDLLPAGVRFSAEDSLPVPTSKPDPAIYALAGERLGIAGGAGLAVEDAAAGAQSAVAAGFPTVGNLQFVGPAERDERVAALRDAGVVAIVPSWGHLAELLGCRSAAGELETAGRAS